MSCGFYGKLPDKGDFISRRLPHPLINKWDSWLQSAMDSSRISLAEQWLNQYLVSPIWRFCISPDIVSDNAFCGVMLPSVDSVGRHFPLMLGMEFAPETQLLHFATSADNWFEQLEDLALSTLSPDTTLEQFDQQLQQVPSPQIENAKLLPAKEHRIGWQHNGIASKALLDAGYALAAQEVIQNKLTHPTHWWTAGTETISPTFISFQGMPVIGDYHAMLNGEWL
ncbi:type VI secretion system-associated protein TagF [Neptunicella marina]|uniref:Type VI secretion system-associated protein TagF n=1 Tax=Neptunicella marina TaxID=2125989 RepID=A0A8J6IUY9_9ALTE|nr:type VI secretion system-associated protein TagF [Neptunicella marina]MBC3766684.1 type VI secretion system-associated protein TagF [Neptunicella marina]